MHQHIKAHSGLASLQTESHSLRLNQNPLLLKKLNATPTSSLGLPSRLTFLEMWRSPPMLRLRIFKSRVTGGSTLVTTLVMDSLVKGRQSMPSLYVLLFLLRDAVFGTHFYDRVLLIAMNMLSSSLKARRTQKKTYRLLKSKT